MKNYIQPDSLFVHMDNALMDSLTSTVEEIGGPQLAPHQFGDDADASDQSDSGNGSHSGIWE